MPQRSFRAWLFGLALLGLTVDLVSKYAVFAWLGRAPHYNASQLKGEYPIIGDVFLLNVDYTPDRASGYLRTISSEQMPRVNHGALFGLGNEGSTLLGWEVHPKDANRFFAGVSMLTALAIIGWSLRASAAEDRLLCISLGLLLGGTLGNLFDRIVFHGVRDFLYAKIIDWPVFNIADCCLVCGAVLLFAQAFFTDPKPQPAPQPAPAADVPAASVPAGTAV